MYREELIRIGAENPQLRHHIRVILDATEKRANRPLVTLEDLEQIKAQEKAFMASFFRAGKAGQRIERLVRMAVAKRHRKAEQDVEVWRSYDALLDMTVVLPDAFDLEKQRLKPQFRPLRSALNLRFDTDQVYQPSLRDLKKKIAYDMTETVKREFRMPPHLMPTVRVTNVERAGMAYGGGKYTITINIKLDWLSQYK